MTPQDAYTPRPEHHFTFGLWTVGNVGRDPFGDPVRPVISPNRIVHKLGELGAYGVNLHDNDLVPRDASAAERDRIVREFKAALARIGREGADGDDEPVRRSRLPRRRVHEQRPRRSARTRCRRRCASIDLGVELGATTYVFWGGREGVETNAAKDPQEAIKWFRDAINFLCEYVDRAGLRPQVRARAQA